MALALDGSTPAAVTTTDPNSSSSHTFTTTTASFTPPAGAVLVVILDSNEGNGQVLSAFAATDNLGGHLTYTHLTQQGLNTNDAQVNIWWAPVVSSAAMTVSAS